MRCDVELLNNKFRGGGKLAASAPFPSVDETRVEALLRHFDYDVTTPLVEVEGLAEVDAFWVKDERGRMGLGSFKALGAAYVIARQAAEVSKNPDSGTLKGRTYVTASAGNHGISVAAGARMFGAQAVVYIAETVPTAFEGRLASFGAQVVRAGTDYAASMEAASTAAKENGWTLLSDSSWEGYTDLPYTLMEGYLQMAHEAVMQCRDVPTHVFLQAGVGGLAGAVAAYVRKVWGDAPRIVVVEPQAAPALQASIRAGTCTFADGPDSTMGRLDCKEPSLIALNGLARDADDFLTVSDEDVGSRLSQMAELDLATTASGGAGMAAAMMREVQAAIGIGPDSRILCFLSEVPE
jgi:diaminopropionate ammonia-lyase